MIVAGFGFRKGAGIDSLQAALKATGVSGVTHFATIATKADSAALTELARATGVSLRAIPAKALPRAAVATHSERSEKLFGTGSLSEAAALLAAGTDARLIVTRVISPDRMATCAIAEGAREGPSP